MHLEGLAHITDHQQTRLMGFSKTPSVPRWNESVFLESGLSLQIKTKQNTFRQLPEELTDIDPIKAE